MNKPVSHVMPESVVELLEVVKVQSDTIALRLYILGAESDIKAAYAKIAELEEELKSSKMRRNSDKISWEKSMDKIIEDTGVPYQIAIDKLTEEALHSASQLSTLQAQMKEVLKAGDEMANRYGWISNNTLRREQYNAWISATATLRQSGHK